MKNPERNKVMEILERVEACYAQLPEIAQPLDGVDVRTLGRWRSGETIPEPDSVGSVARSMWKFIHSATGARVRTAVMEAIHEVDPTAAVKTWRTAEDCGAWFYRLATVERQKALQRRANEKKALAAEKHPAASLPADTNPFSTRGPVTPGAFFGRTGELRRIRDFLRNRGSLQVVGPRRIGKSSLLHKVRHQAAEWVPGVRVAYVDMQIEIAHEPNAWCALVTKSWGWETPAETTRSFADGILEAVPTGRLHVLCLDEFEKFLDLRERFDLDFFRNLRGCAQTGALSLVTASRLSLSTLCEQDERLSVLYNIIPPLDLEPFPPAEAEAFVCLARPGLAPFSAEESAAILAFADGHPMKLQVACYHVIDARGTGRSLEDALRRSRRETDELLPPAKPRANP